MATRLRKTRRQRGSRTHGWGQVAQHRASGHKGGLGASGQLKHHFSGMLKTDPGHFGHDSTHTPRAVVTRKWASVRDLGDLHATIGTEGPGGERVVDLAAHGYDKLLGGGGVSAAYTVRIARFTAPAEAKVKEAGGRIVAAGADG